MSMDQKTQHSKNVSSLQIYIQVNSILVKIPIRFFVNTDKIILKFIWKSKGTRVVKTVFFLFCFLLIYLFIFGCFGSSFLCVGFLQLRQAGATLRRGAWASHYRGLLLWSTGSRRAGSVVVAHGPSCSAACGIFLDQGSNPCPLHQQADSQPLLHQGSPKQFFFLSGKNQSI